MRYLELLTVLLVWTTAGCERQHSQSGSAGAASAAAEAARLDQRRPLPLLPAMAQEQKMNMREHLSAVQQTVAGLAAGDFAAIETASKRLGMSPERHAMCERLAAGSDDFKSQAMGFHRTADSIGEAAHARDAKAVSLALSHTLASCTGCHESFRQEVVDQATWQKLMASRGGGGK